MTSGSASIGALTASPTSQAGGSWFNPAVIIPMLGVLYAVVGFPLLVVGCEPTDVECVNAPRPENRIVWPLLAISAIAFALSARERMIVPMHIRALVIYLAFAGLSVTWAFRPEVAGVRYLQQVMIGLAIVLPALVTARRSDLLHGLFIAFFIACVLNLLFLAGPPRLLDEKATPGFTGYFSGKNYTGMCAAIAVILSLHEMTQRGARRWIGVVGLLVAGVLLYFSNARTAQALAVTMPTLALLSLAARRSFRVSPIVLPIGIVITYMIIALFTGLTVYRLSGSIFGNETFTGRWAIWVFAWTQIDERPWLGWGYQSFWLVGEGGPSEAAKVRWVRDMPNAHSGYIDTIVELGHVGVVLMLGFVTMTVHAIGRVIDLDARHGWCLTALAYFVILMNGLESIWMRGFEFTWLVFLVVAADAARRLRVGQSTTARPASHAPRRVAEMAPVRRAHRRRYSAGLASR